MQNPVKQPDDVLVIVVPSESLTAAYVEEFQRSLDAQMEGKTKVVLDLHQVEFMDSAGCGALLNCLKKLRAVGGSLAVCRITSPVRALFELIRMSRVLTSYPTEEEAIQAVA